MTTGMELSAIDAAIAKMHSLHDGEAAVLEAMACGKAAVPALRALLFERDRAGIYQPRCFAVQALFNLGASAVLFDYLQAAPERESPVERMGDDAVINAAAQYLSATQDERVFHLLLSLAARRYWPGVIGALASFHRIEALPYLVGALAEDDCRLLAEPALLDFGAAALPALLQVAAKRGPTAVRESETSIRTRQRALGLLLELRPERSAWPLLRPLMGDAEARLAVPACALCLSIGPRSEWDAAARRLVDIAEMGHWRESTEAEEVLRHAFPKTKATLFTLLAEAEQLAPIETGDGETDPSPRQRLLRRLSERIAGARANQAAPADTGSEV